MDCDNGRLGLAVMAGVFTAIACGSSAAHLNPAVTVGFAVAGLVERAPVYISPVVGCIYWCHSCVTALSSSLGGDPGYRCQTRLLLHQSGDSQADRNFAKRGDRNVRPRVRGRGNLFKAIRGRRHPESRTGSIPDWKFGLGRRSFSWRYDRLRHQSCAGLRPASGSRGVADLRQGGSDWNYAAVPLAGPVIGGTLAGVLIRVLGL